jgi:hypothetical protein
MFVNNLGIRTRFQILPSDERFATGNGYSRA